MVEIAGMSDDVAASVELIAVRGEELCLAYNVLNNGPDERRSVVLIRSDGEVGLSVDYYDEDQLGEALDELDRQWVDLGGPTQIVDVRRRDLDVPRWPALSQRGVPDRRLRRCSGPLPAGCDRVRRFTVRSRFDAEGHRVTLHANTEHLQPEPASALTER